jgi:hypothetical protein
MGYSLRPDGLYDVSLPGGATVPMSLTEAQLQEAGHQPEGAGGVPGLGAPSAVGGAPGMPAPSPAGGAPQAPSASTPSSVAQPSAQPGNLPPLRSDVIADFERNPNLSPAEKEAEVAKLSASPGQARTKTGAADLIPVSAGAGQKPTGAASSGIRRIPGKDVRASFTVQPGTPVDDEIKGDMADTRPEDATLNAATVADMRDQQQQDYEKLLLDRQKELDVERARRAQVDAKLQAKTELIDKRDQEAEKLTPQTAKDVWENRGAFAQVMSALQITLGGYLQGMQGGQRNPGLDMVNESIQNEVADQRKRYEQALARGQVARNDYAKAIELYGSPEAAEQDMTMRRLAIAESIVKNRGQAIGTQEYLGAAAQTAAELKQQRAQIKLRLNEYERGKTVQENWVHTADQYVGGTPTLKPEQRKRMVRLPNGSFGFVVDESHRQGTQDKITGGTDVLNALGKLQALAHDNTLTDPEKRAKYKALVADIAPVINVAKGQGAMGDQEFGRMSDLLGSPDAIIQDRGAALDEAVQGARSRVMSTIRDNVYRDPNASVPVLSGRPEAKSDE